jgi:hypothetical protein
MVLHTSNLHTLEAKGASSQVQGHLSYIARDPLSQRTQKSKTAHSNLSNTMESRENHQCIHRDACIHNAKAYINLSIYMHFHNIGYQWRCLERGLTSSLGFEDLEHGGVGISLMLETRACQ